jgi:cyclin-dependent kinase 7
MREGIAKSFIGGRVDRFCTAMTPLPMNTYIKKKRLGEGTYAVIYLAYRTERRDDPIVGEGTPLSKVPVAMKRIKFTKYSRGHEISAIREIKALKRIESEFVVKLLDVFIHEKAIHLILEYVDTNLEEVIKNSERIIMPGDIKAWMLMILRGLYECHRLFIVHRDIKPNNILIALDGTAKLADFGLTRKIENEMTPQAVTRWYRAPEILLGAKSYGLPVDMWAVGCVFAELFLRIPLFAGDTDIQQLDLIFKALGTPTEKEWPGMTTLPNFLHFQQYNRYPLSMLFTAATADAIDLLEKLLSYDPRRRIGCLDALKHGYFKSAPSPTPRGNLPI